MSYVTQKTNYQGKDIIARAVGAFNITAKDLAYAFFCYIMSSCVVFDYGTPFAVSIYAAVFDSKKWPLYLVASAVGLIGAHIGTNAVLYIIVLILSGFIIGLVSYRLRFRAICVSSLVFVVLNIGNLLSDAYWYDYFISLIEAVLCFGGVYVFESALPLLSDGKSRNCISDSELSALLVFMTLVIRCTVSMPLVLGMDVSVILSLILLLMVSMAKGLSVVSAVGVLLGIAVSDSSGAILSSMGAFAFSGLCAYALNRFGRWGIVLGFLVANATMSAFFDGEVLPFDIFEVIAAIMIFGILPKSVAGFAGTLFSKTAISASKAFVHEDKIQKVISKRLFNLSESYKSLAKIYASCFKTDEISKEHTLHMLDSAASRICPSCGLKYNCWERNYKESYRAMAKMLETAEQKGTLNVEDIASPLKEKCIKAGDFVTQFNRMYELYRVEKMWREKLNYYGFLVSGQLMEVSNSVKNAGKDLNMCLDTEAEREIKIILDKKRVAFEDVTFLKGRAGFVSEITIKGTKLSKKAEAIVENTISCVTGKNACLISVLNNYDTTTLIYRDSTDFAVSVGKATRQKDGEQVSGDSMITCTSPEGNLLAALSDGMGTGREAQMQSMSAVGLLEDFTKSGMNVEIALELINYSLLLASNGDSFATMDVCCVNLSNGEVRLLKSGASAGYVINGANGFFAQSDSLPFGVLKDCGKINSKVFIVDGWARIIIMSDGVYDVLECSEDGNWDILTESKSEENAQRFANMLLKEAVELSGGKAKDDMSVMVIDVWRKG